MINIVFITDNMRNNSSPQVLYAKILCKMQVSMLLTLSVELGYNCMIKYEYVNNTSNE